MNTNENLDGKVKPPKEIELAEQKIAQIAHIRELKEKEWQRWVPGLNLYRMVKDYFNEDKKLLAQMNSEIYENLHSIYNLVTYGTTAGIGLGFLIKMLGEQ